VLHLCVHLRVEFWLPFELPPKCWRLVKASKRHQKVWWSLRDREWSLRRRRAHRSLCDRWREGKGWKRPVLKWTPQRGLGLRGPNLGKTNHPCLVCLLLVICLLSLSLSFSCTILRYHLLVLPQYPLLFSGATLCKKRTLCSCSSCLSLLALLSIYLVVVLIINSALFQSNSLFKQRLSFYTPIIIYLVLTTNQGIELGDKVLIFRFRLSTPPLGDYQ
jgi:hypothetical protein